MAFAYQDILKTIPAHLHPYVHEQNYDNYTAQQHAVWRYIMRQLTSHLKHHAHPVYQEGLKKTGIGVEKIPSIEEMNACLSHLGWRAVAVDGFIPPTAFMEFQQHKILPIALDMRTFEHVLYTPAPDIVHESAGHAPFLADIDYGEYLQKYGEYGSKALYTVKDQELYEAIRHLSVIKEDPQTTQKQIQEAEERLKKIADSITEPSEAGQMARLFWWVAEYGLVGDSIEDYKIFGAGLLSSMGESHSCLNDQSVKKVLLTVDCVQTPYDITEEQPQLFVTKSCKHMRQILEELADSMCFRRGGAESVQKAIDAGIVTTSEYSSGVQVSGQFNRVLTNSLGKEIYIGTAGPTQICYHGVELPGHHKDYHAHGFGSPVGAVQNIARPLTQLTVDELAEQGIFMDKFSRLEFLSGVVVSGKLVGILREDQKNLIFTFEECTVTAPDGQILFDPEWGTYDMTVGECIVSVYAGAADKLKYHDYNTQPPQKRTALQLTDSEQKLNNTYQGLRDMRETGRFEASFIEMAYETISSEFSEDWLIRLELLEVLFAHCPEHQLVSSLQQDLESLRQKTSDHDLLISRGLNLL